MANNRLHRDSGQRAALTGADLREANLSDANLTEACYDISTTWPEGFDPVAARAVLVED